MNRNPLPATESATASTTKDTAMTTTETTTARTSSATCCARDRASSAVDGLLAAARAFVTGRRPEPYSVTVETIARHIGRTLQVPTVSLTPDEATTHFGDPFMARCFGTDAPASSTRTRALLDWTPSHPTLLGDLQDGDYFAVSA
jgi:hypothetical protein